MTASRPPHAEYFDYTYDMFLASIDGEQSEAARFSAWIDAAEADGLYAFEAARLGAQRTEVAARRTSGRECNLLNFSSYNYLGYSAHPEVIAAAKAALDQFGLGACSSPVQAGLCTRLSKNGCSTIWDCLTVVSRSSRRATA